MDQDPEDIRHRRVARKAEEIRETIKDLLDLEKYLRANSYEKTAEYVQLAIAYLTDAANRAEKWSKAHQKELNATKSNE
jgi:hypothetical protein